MVEQARGTGLFRRRTTRGGRHRVDRTGHRDRFADFPQARCDACRRTGDPSFSVGAVGDLPGDAGNPGGAHAIGDGRPAHCRRPGRRRDQFRRPRGQSVRAWRGRRWGFGSFWHPSPGRHRQREGGCCSACWTRKSGPVRTPSKRRRGASGRLRTRRACAGCEGSNEPAHC